MEKQVIKNAHFFYSEMKQQAQDVIDKDLDPGGKDRDLQLTSNGKKFYLFPLVEQHGFTTWESLMEEYLLIASKQSRLSSAVRMAIDTIVYHVNHRLETYENLETVKKLIPAPAVEKQIKAKIKKK